MTDLKGICQRGGHGDRIMASVRTEAEPWYVTNKCGDRWYFNDDFRARPGRIELDPALLEWAMPFARHKVLIEPTIKGKVSADNKDWGWEKWLEFAERSDLPLLQCVAPGRKKLPGVEHLETKTFQHAVACLAASQGIVTTEGGMHHAAAALGRPAVVIFGAFNSPDLFGYANHINLASPDPEGLGRRQSHPACRAAMNRITVDQVLTATEKVFADRS